MNDRLLTIKEFAEKAGVSQQAIYKQLNKRLKDYIVIENGKTLLSFTALEKYYSGMDEENNSTHSTFSTQSSTHFQHSFNEDSTQEVENSTQKVEETVSVESGCSTETEIKKEAEPIDRIIDLLQKELEEKNKQLAIKDKQIEDLNNRLAEVIELNKVLTYIPAAEKKTELLAQHDNTNINSPATNDIINQQTKKKSFWKRLFGK